MAERNETIRPTDAEAVRLSGMLVRTARYGALAALEPATGAPLASRVAVATDCDGTPLILVSALAAHTGAIVADPRCSLLLGEPGKGDPLAYPRISLACRAARLEPGSAGQARAERRYLNRHPKAKLYSGFPDFSFFRLEVEGAALNAGFGRAYQLDRNDIVIAEPLADTLAEIEQAALDRINDDPSLLASLRKAAVPDAPDGGWRMIGIDAEGFEIARGDLVRRLSFPRPVRNGPELDHVLAKLASGEA